uniref:TilS substrate-binding domain-containing protein n=1 Tax=Desertihabitans aurantiacus TaxID=2282477 RepID=UPI0018E5518D
RELGPGVAEALGRTADLLRADADVLDELAAEVDPGTTPDCTALAALAPAVRHRVLRRWLLAHGSPQPTRQHVLAVDALLTDWHGQGPVDVPGLSVRRDAGRLHPC